MNLSQLTNTLIHDARWDPQQSIVRILPAQAARFAPFLPSFSPLSDTLLRLNNIQQLYGHQVVALEQLAKGKNILLATPTASGKSLTYQLPITEAIHADPHTSALLLFPFKALARDQVRNLDQLQGSLFTGSHRRMAAVYDGDTSQSDRKKIRKNPPHMLVTNPDMLHYGLLPYHTRWHQFLKTVKFLVIDEIHTYRGVFGSQVLQILRRLLRVLNHYGANPQIIACSATIGNPAELAENLVQRPFHVINRSDAPLEARGFVSHFPETKASTAAVHMLESCVARGLKTIVFTKSRRSTELIYRHAVSRRPQLANRLAIYRAGFLPHHRREIEQKLFNNELAGVISTSALELGINIGGLDCCILVGFPGSVSSLWQRAGRVGRRKQPSLVIYIAGEDALDRFWFEHEPQLHATPVERVVVYQDNDEITDLHLECAADELILTPGKNYPDSDHVTQRIAHLANSNRLMESAQGGQFVCRDSMPQRNIAIRSIGESFEIIAPENQKIGHVDGIRVYKECHEGAIYLHGGQVFRVTQLDTENFKVYVEPGPDDIYTNAVSSKETDILEIIGNVSLPDAHVEYGRLRVRERVTGYNVRRIFTGEIISKHELESPEMVFETRGLWIKFPDHIIEAAKREDLHPMGGLHALEHAMIGLYPLVSICDRNDLAGISTTAHYQTNSAAVFIYDSYPGGLGLAESALENMLQLLTATMKHVASCQCETGCPYCIQSPKCGAGNEPLDKASTIFIMQAACGQKPEIPKSQRKETIMTQETPSSFVIPELPPEDQCPDGNELVFDIETQLSADDVGGWGNAHKMRIAICVVYDVALDRYEFYRESDTDRLIRRLAGAERVIGYNSEGFDFKVLKGYASPDIIKRFKSLDLLKGVTRGLGHRTGLDKVASASLGVGKTADGLQSLRWWKEGRLDLIAEYCQKDVEITYRVYAMGKEKAFVLHPHRSGQMIRVPVAWA